MKKKLILATVAAALMANLTGCARINGGVNPSQQLTGEIWYTKETHFLWLFLLGSSVWYCPAPTAPGPATCTQAAID